MKDLSRGRLKRAIITARRLGISGIFAELRAHGLVKSARFVADNFRHIIADALARRWDRQHNVDTAGSIQLATLSVVGPHRELGNECLCTSPNAFDFMVRSIQSEWTGFTFIDIGAGKSRTLLLASRYNFSRVIGVEFSTELVDCSRQNIAKFQRGRQKCRDIEVILKDATEYVIPDAPLLIYFYNPFAREVFDVAFQRISASLSDRKRNCYIIYASSSHNSIDWAKLLILKSGQFEEIQSPQMPFFWDAIRPIRFAVFRYA